MLPKRINPIYFYKFQAIHQHILKNRGSSAVKLMRTRIGLLAQPKSTRSTIDATLREQRHGSA